MDPTLTSTDPAPHHQPRSDIQTRDRSLSPTVSATTADDAGDEVTCVLAVCDSDGAPVVLIGPFPTSAAAETYMCDRDEFLADLERDIVLAERRNHDTPHQGEHVETVVWFVTAPESVFTLMPSPAHN